MQTLQTLADLLRGDGDNMKIIKDWRANNGHVVLSGDRLNGVNFDHCDLEGALLVNADLSGACLDHACLVDAALCGAKLRGADLRGADLRGADLSRANIEGVDMTNAVMDQKTRFDQTAAAFASVVGLETVRGLHYPVAAMIAALRTVSLIDHSPIE